MVEPDAKPVSLETGNEAYNMIEDLHELLCTMEMTPPEGATIEEAIGVINEFITSLHNDAKAFLDEYPRE